MFQLLRINIITNFLTIKSGIKILTNTQTTKGAATTNNHYSLKME